MRRALVTAVLCVLAYVQVTVNEKENRYETTLYSVMVDGGTPPRRLTNGTRDTARISFRLKLKNDDVTLDVINDDGDVVRRLVDDKFMRAGVAQTFRWDGRDDDGKLAPDGVYRPRVRLKDQGRTIVLPIDIRLDKTPPKPVVTVLGFAVAAALSGVS